MAESRSNNNRARETTRNNNGWEASDDDCFFFLHSTCTRDDCTFRHSPAALSTTEVCSFWRAGRCTRPGCKFRHFEGQGGKEKTVCKWEPRPGGCSKPQCPYKHNKPKCHNQLGKHFNVTSEPPIPASLPKMIYHKDFETIFVQFFKEFFQVYDSDNRQPLLAAYCENAAMSLHAVGSMDTIEAYIQHSRNLLRATENQKTKLKIGRLQVVAFLTSLPRTQHFLPSFTLDETFIPNNRNMFSITVSGLFKEKNTGRILHFNRAMVIVPRGTGLCILNEVLFITFPTKAQTESYHNNPATYEDVSMNHIASLMHRRFLGEESGTEYQFWTRKRVLKRIVLLK